MTIKSKIAGTFIGMAIGDALGLPIENKHRGRFPIVRDMIGGGLNKLPAGAWSGLTTSAICLTESLLVTNDLNVYDLMERFKRWVANGENTSTGKCIAIDQNMLRVIGNYERTGNVEFNFSSNGSELNSSLVRAGPIACIHWDKPDTARRIARQQSYLTQSSEVAASACEYLVIMVSHLIAGRNWSFVTNLPTSNDWPDDIKSICKAQWRHKRIDQIKSTSDAVHALETAIWCVDTTDNFEDSLVKAVNLGGSTISIGSLTGQIAGALYGLESIPVRWFDMLHQVDKLTDLAMQLVDLSRSE